MPAASHVRSGHAAASRGVAFNKGTDTPRGWRFGMDAWMDGWMDGGRDGWMEGWMHGWMDECMDGWMDAWMDEWIDVWMDGRNVTTCQNTNLLRIGDTWGDLGAIP